MDVGPTEDEAQFLMESRAEDLALRDEEMQRQIKEIEEAAANEPEDEEEHSIWCECLMCVPGA